MDPRLFDNIVWVWIGVAALVFIALFFINAPYGRYLGRPKGPMLPGRVAWFLFEAPSPLIMAACFIAGVNHDAAAVCFLALWELHYIHRAFIYPLRMSGAPKPVPAWIALCSIGFNLVNASMNGEWLFRFAPPYTAAWLSDPRFIVGVALFLTGFIVNLQADTILMRLRGPGESGYKIPTGGLYRWVSCPNYFGEMVEWCGFALATWSLPALTFAVWTVANLLPRALANHRWYREKFETYPAARKAIIPFVL